MRVHLYKAVGGVRSILFRPRRDSGKTMVLLRGVAREDVKERVMATLEEYERGDTQTHEQIPF